jgi:diadenosine tetraphosphate (Ap4A) HIT family hydrolase
MDITNLTETDLARLALSVRLRDLSEAFRVAVAAEDGLGNAGNGAAAVNGAAAANGAAAVNGAAAGNGAPDAQPALAGRLWSLLATELPKLEEAIVAHLRTAGASWAEVAALRALSEDEARERWQGVEPAPATDPVGQAAALDEWYIRHAQLEPLAQVRDPFSRLLSAHAPQEHECLICVKYRGGALPAYGGYTSPPGGYLLEDGMWRVGHGPTPYWPAGTLLIESRRHFLDFAEMREDEAASIGSVIRRFVGPLKRATGATRIHAFSCMEGAEHFHLWLVPRIGEVPSGRGFIADPGYCSIPEAEQVISRLRQELDHADRTDPADRAEAGR